MAAAENAARIIDRTNIALTMERRIIFLGDDIDLFLNMDFYSLPQFFYLLFSYHKYNIF